MLNDAQSRILFFVSFKSDIVCDLRLLAFVSTFNNWTCSLQWVLNSPFGSPINVDVFSIFLHFDPFFDGKFFYLARNFEKINFVYFQNYYFYFLWFFFITCYFFSVILIIIFFKLYFRFRLKMGYISQK